MTIEPLPSAALEPAPPDVEIVSAYTEDGNVRVVLDVPLGVTVQIMVGGVPAPAGRQDVWGLPSVMATVVRSELAPVPRPPPGLAAESATPGGIAWLGPLWARAGDWLRHFGPEAPSASLTLAPAATRPLRPPQWRQLVDVRRWSSEARLFAIGLVLCAVTRLWAIDQFPIYFYSDEANSVLQAQHLLANHLQGTDGIWLPLYFEGDSNRWTPWLVVYAHLLTSTLFGNSIAVARSTSAIIDLLAPLAVGLMLWRVFRARYWWAAAALIAATPVLFIYARTSFEHSITPALYACFLLAYLLYRCVSPRYLYLALLAGAAVFYSYSNAQLMMVALGALLVLVDFRYHWQQRALWRRGGVLAAVLAAPLVFFRLAHPQGFEDHLRAVGSYWMDASLPLGGKLQRFAQQYAVGLSPLYWFFPNNVDLANGPTEHLLGYGSAPWWLLPFVILGLIVCLRQRLSAAYRTLLLAALVVPLGAAVDQIEIQRVASLAIPLVCLGMLGGEWLLDGLGRISYQVKAGVVLSGLSCAAVWMMGDSLIHGPLWYQDYGLYGMQYGVKQIFSEAIPSLLNADPSRRFIVSTAWGNNVQFFPPFFLPPAQQKQVTLGSVDDYVRQQNDLAGNSVFVMTADEYGRVQASRVLTTVRLLREIDYPNGSPGFYFANLAYTPAAAAVLAAAQSANSQPQQATLSLDGQSVLVSYSRLSDGDIQHAFDGDLATWVRGADANPFVIELHFPQPRSIAGLSVKVGSTPDFSVTALRFATEGGPPETVTQRFTGQPPDPQVNVRFAAPGPAAVLRIEIKFNNEGDRAQIHIWDIGLR